MTAFLLAWSSGRKRSLKKAKLNGEGPIPGYLSPWVAGAVQTRYHVGTWHLRQLKERLGFLINRILTLSSASKRHLISPKKTG